MAGSNWPVGGALLTLCALPFIAIITDKTVAAHLANFNSNIRLPGNNCMPWRWLLQIVMLARIVYTNARDMGIFRSVIGNKWEKK